ncbi:unnamed protein product, partial [Adineta steineri]
MGGFGGPGGGAGAEGFGGHGGMGGNGVITDWLGFRQIDLAGAEWIMNSTDQSNQCEVARLLARQCTEDRAKVKAQFRNHM